MCGGTPDIENHADCIELYASLHVPDEPPPPPPLFVERGDAPAGPAPDEARPSEPPVTADVEADAPDKVPI